MAKIIENNSKRRMIKLNADDIISVIQQYLNVTRGEKNAPIVRDILKNSNFYLQ